MSKVEQLETEVKALTAEELDAFREWFANFEADLWDKQIEADAKSGKLKAMMDRALEDHRNGRSTLL